MRELSLTKMLNLTNGNARKKEVVRNWQHL